LLVPAAGAARLGVVDPGLAAVGAGQVAGEGGRDGPHAVVYVRARVRQVGLARSGVGEAEQAVEAGVHVDVVDLDALVGGVRHDRHRIAGRHRAFHYREELAHAVGVGDR